MSFSEGFADSLLFDDTVFDIEDFVLGTGNDPHGLSFQEMMGDDIVEFENTEEAIYRNKKSDKVKNNNNSSSNDGSSIINTKNSNNDVNKIIDSNSSSSDNSNNNSSTDNRNQHQNYFNDTRSFNIDNSAQSNSTDSPVNNDAPDVSLPVEVTSDPQGAPADAVVSDARPARPPPTSAFALALATGVKRKLPDGSDSATGLNSIRSERLQKIMNITSRIADCINSYDSVLLQQLVQELVRFDCQLVTPRLTLYGRKHFLLYFNTLIACIPDFVIIAKTSQHDVSKNLIHCNMYFTGTKAASTENDNYIKPQGCTLEDPPSFMPTLNKANLSPSKLSALDRIESVFKSNGDMYLLCGKGEWLIYYDPSSLDVIKFEMKYKLTSFKKCAT